MKYSPIEEQILVSLSQGLKPNEMTNIPVKVSTIYHHIRKLKLKYKVSSVSQLVSHFQQK